MFLEIYTCRYESDPQEKEIVIQNKFSRILSITDISEQYLRF